jgi:predicted dehydrogenase
MPRIDRRRFLQSSLAASWAGFAIAGTKASGRVLGANEALRVAVAGLNGRGGAHIDALAPMDGVRVTHLVDPDTRTFARAVAAVEERGGSTPQTVQDVRRVLDDPDVDVLTIAAPNHWHALMTVWACQAGKDVYVEKPCSHDVHEGRTAVAAARKHGRIVQHGTQGRSSERWAQVAELARTGALGKLLCSRALCYKRRPSIGTRPDTTPPAELDYDLWLGPADARPYNENYVHYNWHWFWNFGNGDIGNQGVHQFDVARWMIPGATLPTRVLSLGGRFGYTDQGETPNTQVAVLEFGEVPLVFEVRGLETAKYRGLLVGNVVEFEAGVVTDGGFYPRDKQKPASDVPGGEDTPAPLPKAEATRGPGGGDHFGNFVAAVRSRKADDLNADILEGHYSSALCHLANIAYRLGRTGQFRAEGSPESHLPDAVERMLDHLTRENRLEKGSLEFRVGPSLGFDPEAERFTGDRADEANALLARPGREPFRLPEVTA